MNKSVKEQTRKKYAQNLLKIKDNWFSKKESQKIRSEVEAEHKNWTQYT